MLIIGWTTNDYGRKHHYAALWSVKDTPVNRYEALNYLQMNGGGLFPKDNALPLSVAKAEVIVELSASRTDFYSAR